MDRTQPLYNGLFKARDRFLDTPTACGFEPDVIQEYIHWTLALASSYERGARDENPLLYELFLRQLYFHLLDAIQDPQRSRIFRRLCLDSIHTPLLCLKRHYDQWEDGDIKLLLLQQQLQRVQAPLD
ncbi:hypothetical protein [Vibrio hepatarius]|uniref:hypothetical protein n=1 Tax=Vibrio hepatarius TaxID=171383 RepID=UPI00142E9097|nr:hypothetical protein [Vibrio hepatarius]NIY84366.1 hypothetical protein [Vibrio hepatarius]NVJ57667.1 hypothetical protein [Vibrionaceae bacterium]